MLSDEGNIHTYLCSLNNCTGEIDENGYVTVKVDGYVLVGALGIPVIAPDVEESLNFFQRVLQSNGIIDKLEEMGIQEGDPVQIGDLEFDYIR